MGATKSQLFSPRQNEMAIIAKALAHPARIAIIEHLLKVDACITGDIVEELPLAQPTISQHLKELKAAGILQGTIEGAKVNYCIDGKRWKEIQHIFNGLFDAYVPERHCC